MKKNIIVLGLFFIFTNVLLAQSTFYDGDTCYLNLTIFGGYGYRGGIPNTDTCGVYVWNRGLHYKDHCNKYIYIPLDTIEKVKRKIVKSKRRGSWDTYKKYFFIVDTVSYQGKMCMKVYQTYDEQKAVYIFLQQNGYIPKICAKMPNITDVVITSDATINSSIANIKNLKRVIIQAGHINGLKHLKSKTLEEFMSIDSQLTGKDIDLLIGQNPNLRKLNFDFDYNTHNQEMLLTKVLTTAKKLEYLYLLNYEPDSLPSNLFAKMSNLKGIKIEYMRKKNGSYFAPHKTKLNKKDFKQLTQMKQLLIADYRFTNILEILPELTNLEVLEINLDDYKDNNEIIQVLKQMPKLKCVQVFSDKTRRKELEALLPFKNCDCKD